jgi:hypothetical protein
MNKVVDAVRQVISGLSFAFVVLPLSLLFGWLDRETDEEKYRREE